MRLPCEALPPYPLPEPRYRDLCRLFSVWVGRVIFRNVGIKKSVPEFQDLQEVENMLAETVASWKDTWLAEGRQEGRQEGKLSNLADNIRALMETLGLTREKAMDMLKVSEEDRKLLASVM